LCIVDHQQAAVCYSDLGVRAERRYAAFWKEASVGNDYRPETTAAPYLSIPPNPLGVVNSYLHDWDAQCLDPFDTPERNRVDFADDQQCTERLTENTK
jgi:hypothetical protein